MKLKVSWTRDFGFEPVESIIMNPKQKEEDERGEREKGDAVRCTKQSSKRTYANKRKYHWKNGETL